MNSNTISLPPSAGFNRPKQRRSHATLARILAASERLLADQDFQDLSIPAIAHAARTSVGSFYARFETKEVLMLALHERFVSEADRQISERLAAGDNLPLDELVRRTVQVTAVLYQRHRGILRATFVQTRLHPDPQTVDRVRRLNRRLLSRVRDLWLACLDSSDQGAGAAVGFALGLMTTILRDTLVFQSGSLLSDVFPGDRVLEETALAVLRYLSPWRS